MKFVIRDDDLNYFSTPADIERWYRDIFEEHIPVGFATIPLVRGTSDVYIAGAPKNEREYPISRNVALVKYIKDNSLIEVIQHGTTHETVNGVFEYQQRGGLIGAARRGKEELERAFDTSPRVFAPPHDWISSEGIVAIERAGMDLLRGRGAGLRNWLWRWQYAMIFVCMLFYRFPRYISTTPPVYPYLLNFGKHKEACSYRLEDADVFEGLNYASRKDGVFIVVVHVHTLTLEKKARLLKLITQARALGAQFVRPSELFS